MNITEQNIRSAAIKLISSVGYESMSLRQLATQANINTSTLYTYYQGKQELLVTLILNHFQQLSLGWSRSCPDNASAVLKVKAFVAFHVRHHLANKDDAVLGNMELRSLKDEELAMVRQARRAYMNRLQRLLDQGTTQGVFRCDECKLMSRIIIGMLTQACAWYRDNGQMGIDEVIVYYTQLVLRILGVTSLSEESFIPSQRLQGYA